MRHRSPGLSERTAVLSASRLGACTARSWLGSRCSRRLPPSAGLRSHSPPTTTATRSGRGCVLLRQGRACSRRSRSGSARCRVSASSDGGPGRTSRRADAARDSGRHRWGRHDPASGTDAACTRDGPRASIPGLRERSPGERPWRENRHRPGGGSRRHTDSRPWYHYAGRDGIIPKGNVPTVARILPVWLP